MKATTNQCRISALGMADRTCDIETSQTSPWMVKFIEIIVERLDMALRVISFRMGMEARRVLMRACLHVCTYRSEVNLTWLVMASPFIGQSVSQISVLLALPRSKARILPNLGGGLIDL